MLAAPERFDLTILLVDVLTSAENGSFNDLRLALHLYEVVERLEVEGNILGSVVNVLDGEDEHVTVVVREVPVHVVVLYLCAVKELVLLHFVVCPSGTWGLICFFFCCKDTTIF